MKVKFQQTTKGGCSIYALANIFNNAKMLDGQDFEKGHGIVDLNKILQVHEPEYYVSPLFLTSTHIEYPRLVDKTLFEIHWDKVTPEEKENFVRPFLFTIVGPLRNHCIVALHRLKNDRFYIVDSLKDSIDMLTVEELIEKYHILSVETIYTWDIKDGESMFFYESFLRHLIPETCS